MNKGTLTLLCTIVATVIAVLGYLESNSKQVIVVNPPVIGREPTDPRGGGADILSPADVEEEHQRQLEDLRRKNELEITHLRQEGERRRLEEEGLERKRLRAAAEARAASERERTQRRTNISGRWSLTNQAGTYTFVFQQNGNTITLQEFDPIGTMVGEGSGTIENRSVSLNFAEVVFFNRVPAQAFLELSQDGDRLSGRMGMLGSFSQVTLFRLRGIREIRG